MRRAATAAPTLLRRQAGPLRIEPWRIRLAYLWRHRRWPSLADPRSFTELVQTRKLHDRDARLPVYADKVAIKALVAERLGPDWVIPTLWHGDRLPVVAPWPMPFVVKARHGCNQTIVVRGDFVNWQAIRQRARRWTRKPYGRWLDEWLYRHIPPGLIVEPFIGEDDRLPVDYKFYVFAGRVEYVQVHLGRGHRHRWLVFDTAWNRVSSPTGDPDPVPPRSLDRMIAAAAIMAAGFDFARVDFYEVAGQPLFGEVTFYPGSGLDPFDPVSLDDQMGAHWLRARAEAPRPAG